MPVEPDHGPASGSRLFDIAYRNGRPTEKNDVIAVMAEPHARHEGETMRRRASSLICWLKWIQALPENERRRLRRQGGASCPVQPAKRS